MVGDVYKNLLNAIKSIESNISLNKLFVYYNLNNCIFVHHMCLQLYPGMLC